MKKLLLAFFALSSLLLAKEVTVSIVPQKYFVEKIAGDKVSVNVMVKPGFSPATYEPKSSQMRKLAKSDVYFSIGVPFEKVWLDRFKNANKNMLVVDTSEGIKKLQMEAHSHEEHEEHGHDSHKEEKHDDHARHDEHKHEKHEEDGHDDHGHDKHEEHAKHDEHHDHDSHKEEKHEKHAKHDDHDDHDDHAGHDHSGPDPHIWLDPMLVKVQAKNIYDTLVKIDSANKAYYLANYKAFVKELEALNKEIKSILGHSHDKAFMVFHPSWGYFAKRYDLEQISIEIQGKEPKPAQLVELIKEAKIHNIKIVFVAPQFSKQGAQTIAKSIKGNTAVINPLSYEWKENLIKVANEIAKSYK